jgi:hypothetical protein
LHRNRMKRVKYDTYAPCHKSKIFHSLTSVLEMWILAVLRGERQDLLQDLLRICVSLEEQLDDAGKDFTVLAVIQIMRDQASCSSRGIEILLHLEKKERIAMGPV